MTGFYCKCLAESKDGRILKIGQHLPKLWTNNIVGLYDDLAVYNVLTECSTRHSDVVLQTSRDNVHRRLFTWLTTRPIVSSKCTMLPVQTLPTVCQRLSTISSHQFLTQSHAAPLISLLLMEVFPNLPFSFPFLLSSFPLPSLSLVDPSSPPISCPLTV